MLYLFLLILILLIILIFWKNLSIKEGIKDFTKDIANLGKQMKDIPKKAKAETEKVEKKATAGINKVKDATKLVEKKATAGINKVKNEAKAGIDKIKNKVKEVEKKTAGELKKAIDNVKKTIMKEVNKIKGTIMKEINKIKDIIKYIIQKIKNIGIAFKQLGPQLKKIMEDAIVKPFTELGKGLQKIFVQIGNIFIMMVDKIVSIPDCILYYFVDAMSGMFNGMYMMFPVWARNIIHKIYTFLMIDKFVTWFLYITGFTDANKKCTTFNVMPEYEKMKQDGKGISNAFKQGFGHFKPLTFKI